MDSNPAPLAGHTDLNPQQQAAVDHEGSALVLSGAGTGKTRVIVARIAKLLEDGASPSSILAVTYTNRAAREMRQRIGRVAYSMFIGTFHAFCLRTLQKFPAQAGLPAKFQVIDTADQEAIVRRILQDDMGHPSMKMGGPNPRTVANSIARLKELGVRSQDVRLDQADEVIKKAYGIYEEKTDMDGKVDFAEMLLRVCELLEQDREVRQAVTDRFEHVLIDELQDISALQVRLLRSLRSDRAVFFGVGDDDQSIYRFRGANPHLMQQFAKEYAAKNVLRLEHNYRSTDAILRLANWVIAQNKGRLGKTLQGNSGAGEQPCLVCHGNDEAEAEAVADEVADLVRDGVDPREVAVLYRNNSLSQLIEMELAARDVPFRVHGGVRFFTRSEVKDTLAYLQAANDPSDMAAVARSINTPPRGVGDRTLERIQGLAGEGRDLWEVLRGFDHKGVAAYVAVVEAIRSAAEEGDLQEAARIAIEDSGLRQRLLDDNAPERAEVLDEIINATARLKEELPESTLGDFLQTVAIEGDIDQGNDKVTLMTIHSAKGQEFDHMFLIGVEEEILPTWSAKEPEEKEEERRLLYVAITRARKRLTLSCARQRRFRGEMKWMKFSSLLHGVGNAGLVSERGFPEQASAGRAPRPQLFEQASVPGYRTGQKVVSERFGPGVILALSGKGDKAKAKVLFFKDKRQRWLVLGLANLRAI